MVLSSLVVSSSCVVLVVGDLFLRPEVGLDIFNSDLRGGRRVQRSD